MDFGKGDASANVVSVVNTNGTFDGTGVAEIRKEVYWQLGWLAAEMLGSVDGNRPLST